VKEAEHLASRALSTEQGAPMPRLPLRRLAALTGVAVLGLGALGACGDDDDSGADESAESSTTGYELVPMSEVLAGLPTLVEHGNEAASLGATGDYTGALAEYEELHELWEEIEGTVKDTDRDLYERFETAQGLIKDGAENEDAERIQQGADDQAAAADEFTAANG
jgi:hypothetical protein